MTEESIIDKEEVLNLFLEGVKLAEIGDTKAALKIYEQVLELKPDYSYAWVTKGNALLNLERYDEAINAFDKALEIKPDDTDALTNKSIAHCCLGQFEVGLNTCGKALELVPDDTHLLNLKREILNQLKH